MKRLFKSFLKRFSTQPWCEFDEDADKQIVSIAYNPAFVNDVRKSLGTELAGSYKTDQEIINLWKARRNYESEKPHLEVIHSSIAEDGKLSLKLSWNDAFIRMLKAHGFDGEDEDTIIQAYLASIARENTDGTPAQQLEAVSNDEPMPSRVITAANNIADALDDLPPETVREIERELRSRAQKRRARK